MNAEEKNDRFLMLFLKYFIVVRTVVARTLGRRGTPEDIEDILQDTFLKCRERFDPSNMKNMKQWLIISGKNLSLDLLRKRARRGRHHVDRAAGDARDLDLLDIIEDGVSPEDRLAMKRDLLHLREAMDGMNPLFREVLRLRYEEYLPFRDIAETLGINVNTVKTRHRYGLEWLRHCFADMTARPLAA